MIVTIFGNLGGERGMARTLNAAAWLMHDKYRAIGFMGDDHLPRTPGWDAEYLKTLTLLGTGMVYGDDGFQHEAMPTQIAMTSDIVGALGWMSPPVLRHLNIDIAWKAIGEELGKIRYLPDVLIEHLHPAAGKAVEDEHYRVVNGRDVNRADGAAYWTWHDEQLLNDVARIREACHLAAPL